VSLDLGSVDVCQELEVDDLTSVLGFGVISDNIGGLVAEFATLVLGLIEVGLGVLGLMGRGLGLGPKVLITGLTALFSTSFAPIDFLFLDFVVCNDGGLTVPVPDLFGKEVCDDIPNLGAAELEPAKRLSVLTLSFCFLLVKATLGALAEGITVPGFLGFKVAGLCLTPTVALLDGWALPKMTLVDIKNGLLGLTLTVFSSSFRTGSFLLPVVSNSVCTSLS